MSLRIHVNLTSWPDAPEVMLRKAVGLVLEHEAVEDGELSVTLQSDMDMASLNAQYLSREGPTDVIAFALRGSGETVLGEAVLGDVYLGYERAVAQATERGIPLREELARLAIHGALHVLGYDHDEGATREQGEMFRVQDSLLAVLLEDTPLSGP